MNCIHSNATLHDYVDGALSPDETRTIESHLASCAECRRAVESLRSLRCATAELPREIMPSRDLWAGLAQEVAQFESAAVSARSSARPDVHPPARSNVLQWFVPFAVAASIIAFALLCDRSRISPRAGGWAVASLAGAPRVDARRIHGAGTFHVGQWLETDAASRARVTVGEIGEVSVEPNSRLRLVGAHATEHRLELARGTMQAMIWAPPRIFFVNTPSATAVDLGCAYTLTVNDDGDGELRVQTGYVALEHEGIESIIRGGYMCLTRRGTGPGTPFAEDAPEPLREAVKRFDFAPEARPAALSEILRLARAEDTITLWHLLVRTEGAQRGAVYEALAGLNAPPEGVTRAGILSGDTAMRARWGNHLGVNPYAAR